MLPQPRETLYDLPGSPGRFNYQTGNKAFDRYCWCLTTGNFIGDGCYGNFIRPRHETRCNGFIKEPGELQDFDLRVFLEDLGIPNRLLDEVRRHADEQKYGPVVLYAFWHRSPKSTGKRIVHGILVTGSPGPFQTDGTRGGCERLMTRVLGLNRNGKSAMVVERCAQFLSNE